MLTSPLSKQGKVSRSAFVLAFVRSTELSEFIQQGQPLRAIARHYDRNPDLVQNAIDIITEHEKEVAKGDLMKVAAIVWKGRLGWERSPSFLEAREFIERGEMMPKENCGPKPRRKGRAAPRARIEPTSAEPVRGPEPLKPNPGDTSAKPSDESNPSQEQSLEKPPAAEPSNAPQKFAAQPTAIESPKNPRASLFGKQQSLFEP